MKYKFFSPNSILTVIGKDTAISGSLLGTGPLRIDGRVDGEVNIDGDIIIGETAVINAQVKGRNIRLAGKVYGNVLAAGKLEVLAGGTVNGDIDAHKLQVEDGAILRGSLSMQNTEQKAKTGPEDPDNHQNRA